MQLTDDPLYFEAYLQSLQIAGISTICCLLLGYPLAWAVAHSKPSTRNILLLLVILPSWTSFLIRVYARMGILKNNGVLNNVLLWLGVIDQPLTILHTNTAVYIGIVYAYLPFMVLPIYTALTRIDYSLVEASLDLGARPLKTFLASLSRSPKAESSPARCWFYPGGGRVCDPGTAWRAGQYHDWSRPVAGVFQ